MICSTHASSGTILCLFMKWNQGSFISMFCSVVWFTAVLYFVLYLFEAMVLQRLEQSHREPNKNLKSLKPILQYMRETYMRSFREALSSWRPVYITTSLQRKTAGLLYFFKPWWRCAADPQGSSLISIILRLIFWADGKIRFSSRTSSRGKGGHISRTNKPTNQNYLKFYHGKQSGKYFSKLGRGFFRFRLHSWNSNSSRFTRHLHLVYHIARIFWGEISYDAWNMSVLRGMMWWLLLISMCYIRVLPYRKRPDVLLRHWKKETNQEDGQHHESNRL